MRYLTVLLMFCTLARADFLADVILTPFSWTDNEVRPYIEKNKKTVQGAVVMNTLTNAGRSVLSQEAFERIAVKYKNQENLNDAQIAAHFGVAVIVPTAKPVQNRVIR